jgi:hypothetical protein
MYKVIDYSADQKKRRESRKNPSTGAILRDLSGPRRFNAPTQMKSDADPGVIGSATANCLNDSAGGQQAAQARKN